MATGHVADDVLVEVHLVAGVHQRVEADVDLRLTGGGHLVVLALHLDAKILEHKGDLVAYILLGIRRRDGKIPLLVPDLVTGVGQLLATAVENTLDGVHLIERSA